MPHGSRWRLPQLPTEVVFGVEAAPAVAELLADRGLRRILVISTPRGRGAAEAVASALDSPLFFDQAAQHVRRETVDAAKTAADRLDPEACLAVGGGSAIGLAKALALESGLPYLAVPTTYAGSEMTDVWGITEGDTKRTGRDERVRPFAVVYDPQLTLSLPLRTTGMSGLNAIAHAAEALYAPAVSPLVTAAAESAIRTLNGALLALLHSPVDLGPRADALEGAHLAGLCLGLADMSLHHRIAHVLGGTAGLPHAETHAAVLPHALALVLPAAPAADAALRRALGTDTPEHALWALGRRFAPDLSLASIGLDRRMLPTIVARIESELQHLALPIKVPPGGIRELLERAFSGEPPTPMRS